MLVQVDVPPIKKKALYQLTTVNMLLSIQTCNVTGIRTHY